MSQSVTEVVQKENRKSFFFSNSWLGLLGLWRTEGFFGETLGESENLSRPSAIALEFNRQSPLSPCFADAFLS